MAAKRRKDKLELIGWREWMSLPDLGVSSVKVKVDTGARSSSLHVSDTEVYEDNGITMVRFNIHPTQRSSKVEVAAFAPVLEYRSVRSSSGKAQVRPVIETTVGLLNQFWNVELTLANRDEMGFRMLLGREAFKNRFLVDAGRSYYGGKPPRARKKPRNESK